MDFSVLEEEIKSKEKEILNLPDLLDANLNIEDVDNLDGYDTAEENLPATESETDEDNFQDLFGYDSSDDEYEAPPCTAVHTRKELRQIQESKEIANRYKETGNELVKNGKYREAIEPYTLAISLFEDPIFYANRAMCHIKEKNFAAAEADCTEAIILDIKYVKAHLRRATARKGLGDIIGACRDLQSVVILEPNNTAVRSEFLSLRDKIFHTSFLVPTQ